jgi:tetratricopeptide (TPR) repeat protein
VARRRALWDAAHLRERLATSTEMLTRAREIGNLELELQAHAWLVVDLLEAGDRDAVDAQIEAFIDGAERLRQPLYVWNVLVWRAMRALLTGSLERAEVFASEALEAGASAEAVTAPQYYAIQLLALRREQDRMSELEAPARQMVESQPDRPAWRAALSALLADCGRFDEAREELDALATHRFEDIPRDGDWITAVTLASEAAVAVGDAERAGLLYELLLPYADHNVVIGLAAVCLGSASRHLGKLAFVAGRAEEAHRHLEQALRGNRDVKAPVALAHTQLDYAWALGASGKRATELIDAAAQTAHQLGLPALSRRAAELRHG